VSLLRDALRFGYGSTNVWLYVVRRLLLLVPQVLAVTTIVFFLNRLLPGDPAYMIAGSLATKDVVASVRKQMGLDLPIWDQYLAYLGRVAHGDLGKSWLTSSQVTDDILQRLPATLELISLALLVALLIALPLGMLTALRPGSLVDRLASAYGMLAGAMPDFWWALFLIFVLFGQLQIVPAPIGRIDLALMPPPQVTGFYTIDSILAGDWGAFWSVLSHLALPAFTLAFVYAGPILKMARSTMAQALLGNYVQYARASGLPKRIVARYAFRNALLPVITMTGITYGYLIGGAVLIEQIFAWGGLGQYAVQAVTSSDYMAVSGVVLVTTVFSLLVYLTVDLVYLTVDPRIRY
jgi:ABC-type dipeptide/oligopeptide/nickel transport system permease component